MPIRLQSAHWIPSFFSNLRAWVWLDMAQCGFSFIFESFLDLILGGLSSAQGAFPHELELWSHFYQFGTKFWVIIWYFYLVLQISFCHVSVVFHMLLSLYFPLQIFCGALLNDIDSVFVVCKCLRLTPQIAHRTFRLYYLLYFRRISVNGLVVIHRLFVPESFYFCWLRFGSSLWGRTQCNLGHRHVCRGHMFGE